jgi:hypothetical protein
VAWNKQATIFTPTKNMGFSRQSTRKEDQTINETQGKHHEKMKEEDEGEQ